MTAVNASYNGSIATNASTSFGFNASCNNTGNPAPASFALNGVTCTGTTQPSPSPTSPSPSPTTSPGEHTMGYIGCSMAQNTAQGYAADGGTRMWGPHATGGDVVRSWPDPNSSARQQAAMFGKPTAVWVQVCVFTQGATIAEVDQMIANTRLHAAPGVTTCITGQPQYDPGHVCSLAGASGPALTDSLPQQAAADSAQKGPVQVGLIAALPPGLS